MKNKNLIIAAVVALMLITSIWAQNRSNRNKELVKENAALQAELKKADDDVKSAAALRAELERRQDELEQMQGRFNKAQQKLNELDQEKQTLAEKAAAQDEAVKALQTEKDDLLKVAEEMKQSSTAAAQQQLAAAQKKMDDLQKLCAEEKSGLREQMAQEQTVLQEQIAQQQSVLTEQEQKLTSAVQIIEHEQNQLKACQGELAEVRPALEKTQSELKDMEAAGQQLEEERDKILADADTLRAQVIGLEKMVEERNTALDQTGKELENCKINNNVLISQISQQGIVQQDAGCPSAAKGKKTGMPLPEQKKMPQPVPKQ